MKSKRFSLYCYEDGVKPTRYPLIFLFVERSDEFSQFRYHLRKAKSRNEEFKLTLQDLKDVWDKQGGICPYTGIKLEDYDYKPSSNSVYTASLDRIDSSKGYTKNNIQFVSKNINFMKNRLSHEETVEFCKIISKFWK